MVLQVVGDIGRVVGRVKDDQRCWGWGWKVGGMEAGGSGD